MFERGHSLVLIPKRRQDSLRGYDKEGVEHFV